MALRPPKHSIDAEMVYISQHDPAWDQDKIEADRSAQEPGQKSAFDSWADGEGRYDSKTLPSEYLLEGEEPTKFYLRRLERNLAGVIKDQIESTYGATRAAFDAFRYGVKRIDGLELDGKVIDWPGEDRRKTLSTGDIDVIERAGVHLQAQLDVGMAIVRANWLLTPAEKKS